MEEELAKRNTSLHETAEKLRHLSIKVLGEVHNLAMQRPVGSSNFLRVLEATYRRAYNTLDAVNYLAGAPGFGLSNPAYILTRSLIEDGVSIEYMIAKDKELLAKRFQNFAYIQGHEDNKFLQKNGLDSQPIVQASIADIETLYKQHKSDYTRPDGSVYRNWAGIDIDGMLRELTKLRPNQFGAADNKSFARSYLAGNRKTHFNPVDLAGYLDQRLLDSSYAESMVSALAIGLSVFIRLTTRYIDEISENAGKNMHRDIAKQVITALKGMNKLAVYDPVIESGDLR
jgi:hypothetical protein